MVERHEMADRRRFLNLCVGAIAVTFATPESRAADLPHVAPADPTAQALGYVEDATTVDAKKFPQQYAGGSKGKDRQQFWL